jgi:hypothetical protein
MVLRSALALALALAADAKPLKFSIGARGDVKEAKKYNTKSAGESFYLDGHQNRHFCVDPITS